MPEETETTTEEVTETPVEATEEAAPPPPEPPPDPIPDPPQSPPPAQAIDIDSELTKKESLAAKLEAGEVTYEEYAKQAVAIDRNIVKAQRQLAEPARRVQETIQRQENAQNYWRNWGKGKDVAQTHYGKNVPAAKAAALYKQVEEEFLANPRYQRQEFSGQAGDALIYDKFIDALAAESTKKPTIGKTAATSARASGAGGATGAPSTSAGKTARQRLDDGDYDLGGDAQRLGML